MSTYYDVLKVKRDAGSFDIKRAFYRLAKQYHPDIAPNTTGFLEILNAYKTLIDERKREWYDSTLRRRRIVLPKERISYAVSLRDIADLRCSLSSLHGRSGRRKSCINLKGYDICIHLTQSELMTGSVVWVGLPAHVICPLCRGNRVYCTFCSDRGYILKAVPVPIDIPSDLTDNKIFTVSLREIKREEFAFFMSKSLAIKIKIF